MDLYKADVSLIISESTTLLEVIGLIVADYAWSNMYRISPRFYITVYPNFLSPYMVNCSDIKSCYENLLSGHCVIINMDQILHISVVTLLSKIAHIKICDAAAWIHQHIPTKIPDHGYHDRIRWAAPIPSCVEFMEYAPINRHLSRIMNYIRYSPIGDGYLTSYKSFDMSQIKYIQVLDIYGSRTLKYYRPNSKGTGSLVYNPDAIAFIKPNVENHIVPSSYRSALFFESEEKAFNWIMSTSGWVLQE
jgi:hypothetical protein